MRLRPEICGERLLRRLSDFAEIGRTSAGGVNRQALSKEDRAARHLLADLARARGFKVFQDPIANLFLRREGRNPMRPPMLIGSHLDSQPTGGRFDGALGTLAAFEVLEAVEDQGYETEAAIEVVAWTNEEGSRFTPGVMGSMTFVGAAHPNDFRSVVSGEGESFSQELTATLAALPEAIMRPLGTPISAYLELHIEQGPSLEREGLAAGIVTAVQGTRWLTVTFSGSAGHAGTTSLAYRRDPMVAATLALNRLQMSIMPQDDDARLTVGRFSAHPGSINAIPDRVTFTIDIRHPDASTLTAIDASVRATCEEAALSQQCSVGISTSFDMPPGWFSKVMTDRIEAAAQALGLPYKRMISGAFHDALFVARVAPAAMIFVPCRDGISHNEAEYVEPADVINGARLLLEATLGCML
ncbi:Zn-dependent hydrolase [Rhizobium calliandrae]|uniref:Zn-dependent hydrolase n=1 Tax=Rhizobium calliandrae TaxID=1312182 RepID=A0ABT7KB63_9HYPH|nr:Zn-dependent hydrolase [Rhizobium calliandrae]MDL2405802.1 Zn-dependent hydrolase [Rhizobium calliandrae]